MKQLLRILGFAAIVAIFPLLGGGSSPGAAEPARSERSAPIEAGGCGNSTSSDSSSGSIMITMTGVIDEEASED